MRIYPFGDAALVIEFGKDTSPEIRQRMRAVAATLQTSPFKGFVEAVPAFTSITVLYDLQKITYSEAEAYLSEMLKVIPEADLRAERTVEIPVCYAEAFAPDLKALAAYLNLSVQDIIDLHTQPLYEVAMIGFVPAFPYLIGLPEELYAPRHASPRLAVPAGSVGLAGKQTGIYPLETPGGWQLIGRTPIQLFRPNAEPPSVLQSGDLVKFYPISEREFWERSQHVR
jgi:inhibitor of KinA